LGTKRAAEELNIDEILVSDLLEGHISNFTIDQLFTWLHRIGKEITLEVKSI